MKLPTYEEILEEFCRTFEVDKATVEEYIATVTLAKEHELEWEVLKDALYDTKLPWDIAIKVAAMDWNVM